MVALTRFAACSRVRLAVFPSPRTRSFPNATGISMEAIGMARLKGALLAFVLAASLAVPAAAQIGGHPFEISGGAGIFSPDMRARMETGPAWIGGIGWRTSPLLTLEANGTWAPSNADSAADHAHNFFLGSLDLRWNLRPAFHAYVPYLLLGAGYASSHTTGRAPDLLERGAGTVGAGLLANVYDQRCYLRFQVRNVMFRERGLLAALVDDDVAHRAPDERHQLVVRSLA